MKNVAVFFLFFCMFVITLITDSCLHVINAVKTAFIHLSENLWIVS